MSEVVKAILRAVSSSLQIPTIIILILLILLTILMLGSIIAEVFTERKSLKMNIPELVDKLQGKTTAEMKDAIEKSSLLTRQKEAARELINRVSYPDDTREALARQLIADEEMRYNKIVKITDLTSRVAPMFGLMGTLIPLGPGLIALGQGDTSTLSSSLLIAFDTTVAGLISGAVCFVISGFRKGWYEEYMIGLETIMETILDVQSEERTKTRETIDEKKAAATDAKSAAKADPAKAGRPQAKSSAAQPQKAGQQARPAQAGAARPGQAGQQARPAQQGAVRATQAGQQARPAQAGAARPAQAGQQARPAQAGAARATQAGQQARPQQGAARPAQPGQAGAARPAQAGPAQPNQPQPRQYSTQTIVQPQAPAPQGRPQNATVPTGTTVNRTLQEEIRAAELAMKQAEERARAAQGIVSDRGEDVIL